MVGKMDGDTKIYIVGFILSMSIISLIFKIIKLLLREKWADINSNMLL